MPPDRVHPPSPAASTLGTPGLGLDAGGTQTRWALASAQGSVMAESAVAGLSALQLASAEGAATLRREMRALADAVRAACAAAALPAPRAIVAGFTGLGPDSQRSLQTLLAETFVLPTTAVRLLSDIELACRAAFAPGAGCVVYAGTGSIAAFIDAGGVLHRAGGRGGLIDDAGGGHWIACQALRQVWRAEDLAPGAWQASLLAQQLFAAIGGSDWAATRQWVYGASRGDIGTLACAIAAAAAAGDAAALALLQQAGHELARLARAMLQRHGPLLLALAGRVFDLHPAIEAALREALPVGTAIERLHLQPHRDAARLAATEGNP